MLSRFKRSFKKQEMREFRAGDRVKFVNDVGTATVLRLDGDAVIVEDEDGFERTVERSELMDAGDRELDEKKYGNKLPSVAQLLTQEVGERRMKELQRDFEVRYRHAQATSMSRRDAHMEVDLHIHELVDDQRGLADRAKLAIQMAHFERMMDIAKREKLRRIVFIHGVGQGCCDIKFGPHSTVTIRTATAEKEIRGNTGQVPRRFGWARLLGASSEQRRFQSIAATAIFWVPVFSILAVFRVSDGDVTHELPPSFAPLNAVVTQGRTVKCVLTLQ